MSYCYAELILVCTRAQALTLRGLGKMRAACQRCSLEKQRTHQTNGRPRDLDRLLLVTVLLFTWRWLLGIVRQVTTHIRGNGNCPKQISTPRYGVKKCNRHDVTGDNIRIAKPDMVREIDGSGSLRECGGMILMEFTAGLIDNYKGEWWRPLETAAPGDDSDRHGEHPL